MLGMLVNILQIIGIVLAVLVGLVVLVLCVVLFVPIRYEGASKFQSTVSSVRAKATCTWLFSLMKLEIQVKDGKLRWRFRFANQKRRGGSRSDSPPHETGKAPAGKVEENAKIWEETEADTRAKAREIAHETDAQAAQKTVETVQPDPDHEADHSLAGRSDESGCKENPQSDETGDQSHQKRTNPYQLFLEKAAGAKDALKRIFDKIKYTCKQIYDRIVNARNGVQSVIDFCTDPIHRDALHKVIRQVRYLYRHLKPKKATIRVLYGFEDPCTTGQVLAGLSVLYPFVADIAEITPDFEQKVLDGYLYAKGTVRIGCLVYALLRLVLSGHVRTTYHDIQNFGSQA